MNDDPTADRARATRSANRSLLRKLLFVVVAMFGFGFLLVPFYEKICEVTGLRNIGRADASITNTQVDVTREVRIEFDTNLRNLSWTFRPLAPMVSVHPGEVSQVEF